MSEEDTPWSWSVLSEERRENVGFCAKRIISTVKAGSSNNTINMRAGCSMQYATFQCRYCSVRMPVMHKVMRSQFVIRYWYSLPTSLLILNRNTVVLMYSALLVYTSGVHRW